MTYLTLEPHPELTSFVETLWLQDNPSPSDRTPPTRVVPGCGVELVICYRSPFERLDGTRAISMPMALVSGQRMRAVSVRATGATGMVIARCYPWAARALLGATAPEDLVDGHAALDEIDLSENARYLYERVADEATPEQRLRRVSHYLRRVFAGAVADPLVVAAIHRVNASWGRISVESLASELSVSRRHLHRRFVHAVGVGVKRFARLVRFQKALGSLRAGLPWSDTVGRCDYVDQAHWIAESQAFMGQTPGTIARQPTTPLMRHFNAPRSRSLNTTAYL